MPELPEVETVAEGLRRHLVGEVGCAVWTSGLRLRRPIEVEPLRQALVGARVERVERFGKYLLLYLSRGNVLLAHLGMTGRLQLTAPGAALSPHTHLRLSLTSGRELRFIDPRRFGILALYRQEEVLRSRELAALGPDPLGAAFTVELFAEALRRSTRHVREMLLDQHLAAGIGNIYACEALFLAGVNPATRANRIGRARVDRLHRAIRAALEQGLRNRGTTFRDYADANGQQGGNQHALAVYGREGKPCPRCGATIERHVIGGRSAFYCPRCQRR